MGGRRQGGAAGLARLNRRIVACRRCPRLVRHCRNVAAEKRAAYRHCDYHGRPVANFVSGPGARLLVVGLAPGAHGANRTGRMFTGDRSGDFLYRAMYEAGFATQAASAGVDDGLRLIDAAITAAAHCAPPANKPTPDELANCAPFLDQTFDALPRLRVAVCLGRLAHEAVLRLYKRRRWIATMSEHRFSHGAEHGFDAAGGATPPTLLCSYHPSQQNTFTGKLTPAMLRDVFARAAAIIRGGSA